MTGQLGVIYMLHFDQPYRHAKHYVGWTDDLLDRLDRHASGHGARLVAVIWQAGIGFTLIRICEGTRRTERAIKNAGGAARYCPACTPRPWNGHWSADHRRPDPPHLPQPRRKAVTPMPKTGGYWPQPAEQPLPARRAVRQVPPHPGRHRLAVAHRTPHPVRPGRRVLAAGHLDHPHLGRQSSSAALAAVVLAVPHSRRFITRRFWCVLARHRLQRLCYEARLHTRSGRLPLILWTRPTKVGERTWVLCRAGICAEDFEAHIGELRAACYARDARVTRNRRWSHLVTIDIIRRDTLAASELIASPLAAAHRALPPAGPRPRRRARASRLTRHGGPRTSPGGRLPRPLKGGTCHDRH